MPKVSRSGELRAMVRKHVVSIMALACVWVAAHAEAQDGPPSITLRHATLLDGVDTLPRRDVAITLRAGRIESVSRDDDGGSAARGGARDSIIDLHGAWVVPGLIDAHTHLGTGHLWGEPDSFPAQRALDSGVTTVRALGFIPGYAGYADIALRERFLAGTLRLPRIHAAGEWLLPVVGEHWLGDFPTLRSLLAPAQPGDTAQALEPGPHRRLTGNAAAIDSAVGVLKAHGADWIKAFASGRGGVASSDPLTTFLDESDLRAVVLAARRRGLPVAAHAHSDAGIRAAVLAGARTIEHGTYASEETLRLMRDRGTCLVPTLSSWAEPSADPVVQARAAVMGAVAQRTVRRARDLGVPIIAGSDSPYAPWGEGLAGELSALEEAGLSPAEVLRAATSQSAECLGLADSVGSVRAGLEADLLVLDGDPRSDVARLSGPRIVILAGRLVGHVSIAAIIRDVLTSDGIEAARERSRELHEARVDSIRYGEFELLALGHELLEKERVPEAVAVFEMNAAAYPDGPNTWDSLGDGLLAAGRRDAARDAYGRAVMLAEKQHDPRLPYFRGKLEAVK